MASTQAVTFPYKVVEGRPSPMILAGLNLNGRWRVAELYVDSGAFYTLLHSRFASGFGLDPKSGHNVFAQVGDGSLIPVYLHKLPMQIGACRFEATVGFSEKLGIRFNLLGRLGVFEHFKICFHEKRRMVSFQPLG